MGKNHNANGKCLLQSHHFTSKFNPSTTRTLIKENQIVGNIICRNLFTTKETKEYLPEKHIPEIKKNSGIWNEYKTECKLLLWPNIQ